MQIRRQRSETKSNKKKNHGETTHGTKNKLARNHYPYHIYSYHKQVQCDSRLRHPPVRPPNPEQQPHNPAFLFFSFLFFTYFVYQLQLVYNLNRLRSRNSVRSATKIHPVCRADVGVNVQSIVHAGRERIASQLTTPFGRARPNPWVRAASQDGFRRGKWRLTFFVLDMLFPSSSYVGVVWGVIWGRFSYTVLLFTESIIPRSCPSIASLS